MKCCFIVASLCFLQAVVVRSCSYDFFKNGCVDDFGECGDFGTGTCQRVPNGGEACWCSSTPSPPPPQPPSPWPPSPSPYPSPPPPPPATPRYVQMQTFPNADLSCSGLEPASHTYELPKWLPVSCHGARCHCIPGLPIQVKSCSSDGSYVVIDIRNGFFTSTEKIPTGSCYQTPGGTNPPKIRLTCKNYLEAKETLSSEPFRLPLHNHTVVNGTVMRVPNAFLSPYLDEKETRRNEHGLSLRQPTPTPRPSPSAPGLRVKRTDVNGLKRSNSSDGFHVAASPVTVVV